MSHHSVYVAPGVFLPPPTPISDPNFSPSSLSYKQIAQETINIRSYSTNLTRLRLSWSDKTVLPSRFLIIYKDQNSNKLEMHSYLSDLCKWILNHSLLPDQSVIYLSGPMSDYHCDFISPDLRGKIQFYDCKNSSNDILIMALPPPEVDLIITVGGDGTILNAAWLYQKTVPPILSFHCGTLGFLTEFEPEDYSGILDNIFGSEGTLLCMRMRLECQFIKGNEENVKEKEAMSNEKDDKFLIFDNLEKDNQMTIGNGAEERSRGMPLTSSFQTCTWQVLNELTIDRGSPFMGSIDIYGDGQLLTTVLGDGLIIATPTGSTAYSMSAGGSLVHPQIPSILITPICSHSLSFRPFLLPDSISLELTLNPQSRARSLWISFDGRASMEVKMGDRIIVRASHYPVPTICKANQTIDWFRGLSQSLKWNERPMSKYS